MLLIVPKRHRVWCRCARNAAGVLEIALHPRIENTVNSTLLPGLGGLENVREKCDVPGSKRLSRK